MLYAYVMDNQIKEERDFAESPPDMSRKGFQWLQVNIIDPSYDSAIEVKTGPVVSIINDTVEKAWTVRAKTTQELDNEKESAINAVNFLLLELAFDHENRIRILESKIPITKPQFRTALKARLP